MQYTSRTAIAEGHRGEDIPILLLQRTGCQLGAGHTGFPPTGAHLNKQGYGHGGVDNVVVVYAAVFIVVAVVATGVVTAIGVVVVVVAVIVAASGVVVMAAGVDVAMNVVVSVVVIIAVVIFRC